MAKKVLITTLGLATLIAVGVIGTSITKAEEEGYKLPIVTRIAENFDLEEDEVQAVFDAARDERHQMMQQGKEEKLNQAVSDGVITQEQREALQNKWEEMKAEKRQYRGEMEVWMEEQGIDNDALREYMGFDQKRFGRMKKTGY